MSDLLSFWQFHAPIFSILIPAFTAFILILLGNPGSGALESDWRQPLRRSISLISVVLGLVTAISYFTMASHGDIQVYHLAEWSAPFGIVLVLDRLSAFMLLLTYLLATPVLWFASKEWDLRGRYFHTMFHLLLMGICGAFLTGDLFNLFVFFEILLMASYVLLLHTQGKARFQLGIHYVTINLVASSLFLLGLGMIYGSVGSLNMADVARLIPELEPDQHNFALAGSMLLFVVFGVKAAMLPVGFWLPKTYAVATTPIAAIFTIMTKVGIYAILRINGTVFHEAAIQQVFQSWLLPIGLVTSIYGVICAMATDRMRRFVGFMMLSSIGTILIAIAISTVEAWAGALYYLVHSTLVAATFYLLCGWITSQRGEFKDHFKVSMRMKQGKLIAFVYFIAALMMAGLPPFSGFLGKVFILQAAVTQPYQAWVIGIILLVSLFSIIAMTRVGYVLFWRATSPVAEEEQRIYQSLAAKSPPRNDRAIYILLGLLTAYMLFAPSIYRYTYATAEQLKQPDLYTDAILNKDRFDNVISVQPFDPSYVPETKYRGESYDRYAPLIPDIISPNTLNGEHISEFKREQIEQEQRKLPIVPDEAQLVPMEP